MAPAAERLWVPPRAWIFWLEVLNPVALRLPDEVSQRLKRLADLTGRSKTFYVAAGAG